MIGYWKAINFYLLSLKSSQLINSLSLTNPHIPTTQLQQLPTFPQSRFTCSLPCRVWARARAYVPIHLPPAILPNKSQIRHHFTDRYFRIYLLKLLSAQAYPLHPKDLQMWRRGTHRSHKTEAPPTRPRRKLVSKLKSQSLASKAHNFSYRIWVYFLV